MKFVRTLQEVISGNQEKNRSLKKPLSFNTLLLLIMPNYGHRAFVLLCRLIKQRINRIIKPIIKNSIVTVIQKYGKR